VTLKQWSILMNYECDSGEIAFLQQAVQPDPTNHQCYFVGVMKSKYACPSRNTGKSGLSGGSVFVIMFFVVGAMYFGGGIAYKYKRKGTTGIESIPNIDFWRTLPGLVKDGCRYSWQKACVAYHYIRDRIESRSGGGETTGSTGSYEEVS